MIEVVRSPDLELVWPAPSFTLATLFFLARETTLAMARSLDEIVRLDRRWFWAHPKRRHRCRWPDTGELDLLRSDRGARLIMAIRHLGRGHVVYQPVIFQGALPADEESAAVLFALAARSPEPIPVIAQTDVRRLRRGVRQQTQSHEDSAIVGTGNGWDLAQNEPRLGQAPAGTGSRVGHSALER